MHGLKRVSMNKTRTTSVLRFSFTAILLMVGCGIALQDAPRDAVGVTIAFASIILLPAAVLFFGVRSAVGIVVVGSLLLGMDARIWLILQDMQVGEEIGVGIAAFVNSIYALGIVVVGAVVDWVARNAKSRSTTPTS